MRQHPFLSDVQYGSEYDVVVAKDVLFTLHDPGRALSEWISLLKPGGKLLIMDGNYFYDTVLDEYRKRRDYIQTKYGKKEVEVKLDIGNIDYGRLREIAGNLYPNRIRRPSWDLWFLMGLGIRDIRVLNTDSERFEYLTEYGRMQVPVTYAVSAQIPFDASVGRGPEPAGPEDLESLKRSAQGSDCRIVRTMGALSTADRLRIATLLKDRPLNVRDLCFITGLPQNLVSYDLRVLKEGGIVHSEKKGRETVYSVTDRDTLGTMIHAARSLLDREDVT